MFTGLVTDIGCVRSVSETGGRRLVLETTYDLTTLDIGASVSCHGVCLTVVKKGEDWFCVDVSPETLARTTLRDWGPGTRVNLERPLKIGDELGGHIVTGHIDGTGVVTQIRSDGDSVRFTFEVPPDLSAFIASKGSIAIDGVSLTVNEVTHTSFGVNIIPHTQQATTFQFLRSGAYVNLEVDILARYISRMKDVSAL